MSLLRHQSAFMLHVAPGNLCPGMLQADDLAADLVLVEHEANQQIHGFEALVSGPKPHTWRRSGRFSTKFSAACGGAAGTSLREVRYPGAACA